MKIILSVLILFCLNVTLLFSQANGPSVAVRLGTIATFQNDLINNKNHNWAIYPEVEVGGNILTPSYQWSLNLGYWDDGVNHKESLIDRDLISYNTWVLGWKVSVTPENILFNSKTLFFSLKAGMTINFSTKKRLSSSSEPDINETIVQPYLGIQLNYLILRNLYLSGEIGSNIGISRKHLGRPNLLGGVRYFLQ